MSKPSLTLPALKVEAKAFAAALTKTPVPELFGVTDGKAVGTYVEQAFQQHLSERYSVTVGNSAIGVDLPGLEVDLKVTSATQPQSSSPFKSASQKVYGLGHHLLVFVYEKRDDSARKAASLPIRNAIFVDRGRTADFQTTTGILGILRRKGNEDDLVAFFEERNLPLDDIGRRELAKRVLDTPPQLGSLTISNALQWRLQYGRAISLAGAGNTEGVENLLA